MSFYNDNEEWLIFGFNSLRLYSPSNSYVTAEYTKWVPVYTALKELFGRDIIFFGSPCELELMLEAGQGFNIEMFEILDASIDKYMKIALRRTPC